MHDVELKLGVGKRLLRLDEERKLVNAAGPELNER